VSAPHHLSAAWRDADALRTQGQLAAARDLLEPVADVAAIRLGADNPDVIETMRRLAVVHRELGELASARRVLEEALEGAQLRLNEDDPVVLGISGELGAIADELGNRHEARRNFTRVARYGPAAFGPQHPYVRAAQRFLGAEAPVAEPAPEAQAGFAPARGYDVPPPGFGPPTPVKTPPAPVKTPPAPVETTSGVGAPPPVREEPGVYRPAARQPAGPERAPDSVQQYQPGVGAPPPEPPRNQQPVNPFPVSAVPAPYPETVHPDEEPHRGRTPLLVLAVVAIAALVATAVVAAVAFLGPKPAPQADSGPGTSAAPTDGAAGGLPSGSPGAAAPTNLKLRDDGDPVVLTWTDPSGGTVPFFVEVGQAGAQLKLYARLSPGETSYPVVGLNPRLDYCFSVIAVYSANLVAPSNLVCTQRSGRASTAPTR